MTEAEFNACGDSEKMLKWLQGQEVLSERKARLCAVACCRRILAEIDVDPRDVHAVDVAERYVDGEATAAELDAAARYVAEANSARRTAAFACRDATSRNEPAVLIADCTAGNAAWAIAEYASGMDYNNPAFTAVRADEMAAQATILRDVLGPLPFRPITIESAWRTPVVLELARTIYDGRDFSLLPVLGAALSDAGCSDSDVLGHCGNAGPHVRGCFLLDLILGKS